jgi:hypothetical protein
MRPSILKSSAQTTAPVRSFCLAARIRLYNAQMNVQMSRYVKIGGILVVFLAALFLLAAPSAGAQYSFPRGGNDYVVARERFEKEIKNLGGKKAYERFSIAMRGLSIDEQHGYAHQFGSLLYRIEGEKGVSACDANFGLGCFHQFLGDAIADIGTSSITRLYDGCAQATGTRDVCEHGLGHGILASSGYEVPDLRKALALCNGVSKEKPVSGCKGGAFMEYNMHTIAVAEGISDARALDKNIYAPCDALAPEDAKICTFWLPQWWYFSVLKPTVEAYKKMGVLCEASPYPQTCYEGIGYITPTAFGFQDVQVRDACDRIEHGGNIYCRAMAALIFHITVQTRGTEQRVCDGLPSDSWNLCMQYAAHDRDFSFSVPAEPVPSFTQGGQ